MQTIRTSNQIIGYLIGAAIFAGLASICIGAPRYTLVPIGSPDDGIIPFSINEHGQIVGQAGRNAFLYDRGSLRFFTNLDETVSAIYVHINDRALIAGTLYRQTFDHAAFFYQLRGSRDPFDLSAARFIPIPGLMLDKTNLRGVAIGSMWIDEEPPYRAVVYRDGMLSELPALEPDLDTYATDINDRDEIVGYSLHPSFGRPRALLWRNGQVTDLGLQAGWQTGAGIAINDRGIILAAGSPTNSEYESWQLVLIHPRGTIVPLPMPPEVRGFYPRHLNNRNEVIGTSERIWSGPMFQSWLYSDGVLYDLQTLIEANTEYMLDAVTDINDRGEIIGFAHITRDDGDRQAGFLLVPR